MIVDVALEDMCIRLDPPVHTARGVISERVGVVLILTDDRGHVGRGEIAPLAGWSSCTLDLARAQLEAWVESVLATRHMADTGDLAREVQAGIDAASWGMRAEAEGLPLWRVLGGSEGGGVVRVNALLAGEDPDGMARLARQAQADGFSTLKTKLGMGVDAAVVGALADVVDPDTLVRLDANGAWAVDEAIESADSAATALGGRLEYIEDPVASLDELERFRESCAVPVAVDELLRTRADLDRVLRSRLADVVVFKPALLGGISRLAEPISRSEAAGVDVVISSVYDGPVGLAAWCHLAAGLGPKRAHGLGTAVLLDDPRAAPLVPRQGAIRL